MKALAKRSRKNYEVEVRQRWGNTDAYRESQRRWKSYTAEDKRKIGEEGNAAYQAIVAAMPYGPASPQAQEGIARWHQHLRYFYEPTPEIMLGLADAYNDDPRFAANFQRIHPDLAGFMREAIRIYCKGKG